MSGVGGALAICDAPPMIPEIEVVVEHTFVKGIAVDPEFTPRGAFSFWRCRAGLKVTRSVLWHWCGMVLISTWLGLIMARLPCWKPSRAG